MEELVEPCSDTRRTGLEYATKKLFSNFELIFMDVVPKDIKSLLQHTLTRRVKQTSCTCLVIPS